MDRVQILGVSIDAITQEEAVARILGFLETGIHHVMTPNSEMLVEASRNSEFLRVLQSSNLNLPDSVGLLYAALFLGKYLPARVAGVDTVESLCAKIGPEHPVFFLGGRNGVGAKAAEMLMQKNPRLVVAGIHEGDPTNESAPTIIAAINASNAHLLLVAYGAPAQDLWIHQHFQELTNVRVAMGVGGTFDFLAGNRKRAPQWMQSLGIEWLYRLIQEPDRLSRIWTAVIVFPLLVIRLSLFSMRKN